MGNFFLYSIRFTDIANECVYVSKIEYTKATLNRNYKIFGTIDEVYYYV